MTYEVQTLTVAVSSLDPKQIEDTPNLIRKLGELVTENWEIVSAVGTANIVIYVLRKPLSPELLKPENQ